MGQAAHLVVEVAGLSLALVLPLRAEQTLEKRGVVVNLLDRNGNQPLGLTAANFRGTCRGQPVDILSATLESRPRRVAIVVDTSASMEEGDGPSWKTAQDLVSVLTPDNAAVVLTLSDRLARYSDLSNNPEVLGKGLSKARRAGYSGASALYSGLAEVSRAVGDSWDVGDVVAVITDGEDTASRQTAEASTVAIARNGLRMCVVWLDSRLRKNRAERAVAESWVQGTVRATGGFALRPANEGIESLRSLVSWITQVYRLEVALPQGADRSQEWQLKAVDEDGKELEGVTVVYPHLVTGLSRLVPPAAETTRARPLPGNSPCVYPAEAQRGQVAGPVLYTAQVSPDGRVKSVDIRQVPAEHLGFEETTRTCVSKWRFEPAAGESGPRQYDGKVQYRIAITAEVAIRALLEAFGSAWNANNAEVICALQRGAQQAEPSDLGSPPSLAEQFTRERTAANWSMLLEPDFKQILFLRPDAAVIRQPFRRQRTGDGDSSANDQLSLLEATAIKRGESWTLFAWSPIAGPLPSPGQRLVPGIEEPRKVKLVDPIYPDLALRSHVEGVVVLELVVDSSGQVASTRIVRGHPLLDDSTLEAARAWKYTPAFLAGAPIPVVTTATTPAWP